MSGDFCKPNRFPIKIKTFLLGLALVSKLSATFMREASRLLAKTNFRKTGSSPVGGNPYPDKKRRVKYLKPNGLEGGKPRRWSANSATYITFYIINFAVTISVSTFSHFRLRASFYSNSPLPKPVEGIRRGCYRSPLKAGPALPVA